MKIEKTMKINLNSFLNTARFCGIYLDWHYSISQISKIKSK